MFWKKLSEEEKELIVKTRINNLEVHKQYFEPVLSKISIVNWKKLSSM